MLGGALNGILMHFVPQHILVYSLPRLIMSEEQYFRQFEFRFKLAKFSPI